MRKQYKGEFRKTILKSRPDLYMYIGSSAKPDRHGICWGCDSEFKPGLLKQTYCHSCRVFYSWDEVTGLDLPTREFQFQKESQIVYMSAVKSASKTAHETRWGKVDAS